MPPSETSSGDSPPRRDVDVKNQEVALRVIEGLLVSGEYVTLVAMAGGRLSAEAVERAVMQYGRTLTQRPEEAWQQVEYFLVEATSPTTFHVALDLFTVEEGRSDLTLETYLVELPGMGIYEARLLDLHVL